MNAVAGRENGNPASTRHDLHEPLGVLRQHHAAQFGGAVQQEEGLTMVITEHVMRAVMALADQIVVLHHGEVIARGAPATIVRNPAVLDCYLGEDAASEELH